MSSHVSGRPEAGEYDPYFSTYVDLVPESDILATLESERVTVLDFLRGLTEAQAEYRYAAGKWSLRELIGHMIDTEWVFGQRALWFARGTDVELPGMDQDEWALSAQYDGVPIADLCAQFDHLRSAGLMQYRLFSEAVMMRRGRASGCDFSIRALLYILVGHPRHHLGVVRDRYL